LFSMIDSGSSSLDSVPGQSHLCFVLGQDILLIQFE